MADDVAQHADLSESPDAGTIEKNVPTTLANGSTVEVQQDVKSIPYHEDPAQAEALSTVTPFQVAVTDAGGSVRTVQVESAAKASELHKLVVSVAHLLGL